MTGAHSGILASVTDGGVLVFASTRRCRDCGGWNGYVTVNERLWQLQSVAAYRLLIRSESVLHLCVVNRDTTGESDRMQTSLTWLLLDSVLMTMNDLGELCCLQQRRGEGFNVREIFAIPAQEILLLLKYSRRQELSARPVDSHL